VPAIDGRECTIPGKGRAVVDLSSLLTHWSFEPLVTLGLLAAAILYVRGISYSLSRGIGPRITVWRLLCFFAGLFTVLIALESVVDEQAAKLFWVHVRYPTAAAGGLDGAIQARPNLAVRATGSCNRTMSGGVVHGIPIRYCRPLHRADGYTYQYQNGAVALPPRG
jgi:hypothetical protein